MQIDNFRTLIWVMVLLIPNYPNLISLHINQTQTNYFLSFSSHLVLTFYLYSLNAFVFNYLNTSFSFTHTLLRSLTTNYSWIPKHPGGVDMITLAAGRDITNMFESYHPFSGELATAILKKHYVCDISDTELPR